MSQSKVSKIERGFLLPSVNDVDALGTVYGLPPEEVSTLKSLVAELRDESRSRVVLARGMSEMQRKIGQLEASSALLRSFQPTLVIGLLQTPAYMRCVFNLPQDVPPDEVGDAVKAREARQAVLADQHKQFVLIMIEGALRWQAASASIMAQQIEALIEAAMLPNVRVGIIPWTTPVNVFPRHGFHLYDTDAVIVATETATATLAGPADVATYVDMFEALENLAAFGDDARKHLVRIANDYRNLDPVRCPADSGQLAT
ncbi:helix-turn-helix transcriptional regulator [Nonomuraea sp. NPDC050643]|uniref:helix-turn-helix domain-containing protein n=1 Tax=Nonomuraea sp. NPDC050643 TaxID=3155660 RepID=UPI00340758AA